MSFGGADLQPQISQSQPIFSSEQHTQNQLGRRQTQVLENPPMYHNPHHPRHPDHPHNMRTFYANPAHPHGLMNVTDKTVGGTKYLPAEYLNPPVMSTNSKFPPHGAHSRTRSESEPIFSQSPPFTRPGADGSQNTSLPVIANLVDTTAEFIDGVLVNGGAWWGDGDTSSSKYLSSNFLSSTAHPASRSSAN